MFKDFDLEKKLVFFKVWATEKGLEKDQILKLFKVFFKKILKLNKKNPLFKILRKSVHLFLLKLNK